MSKQVMQRLYIEDIASRLEARPDVYVTAAAELLRSLAKDIDTTKQAKEDIAAAWVAGYYHAGYTYDAAMPMDAQNLPLPHGHAVGPGDWTYTLSMPMRVGQVMYSAEVVRELVERATQPDTEAMRKELERIGLQNAKLYDDFNKSQLELERVKGERDAMRQHLILVKDCLMQANECVNGPICDTIWYSESETLFDYIDAAIAAQKEENK